MTHPMTVREFYRAWQLMTASDRAVVALFAVGTGAAHHILGRYLRKRDEQMLRLAWDFVKFIGRVIRGRAAETTHEKETKHGPQTR